MQITGASIAANGVATVSFTITDGANVPLDLGGRYTEGVVTPRFVVAWLGLAADGTAEQYTAYTTRPQTSPITHVTAVQASTDTGGTFTEVGVGLGTYQYQLATHITVADPSKTHTVSAYATRTFDGATYVANAEYDFLPAGGTPTVAHAMVTDAACNGCHDKLSAHGGSRRDVKLCATCHTAQTIDPDTGNTIDLKVMIHKIHRGKALPSVVGGTPYQLIGFNQAVSDWSTVVFPQDVKNCQTCHSPAAPQTEVWRTRPTRAACGSCHDRTSFVDPAPAGWTLHTAGGQPDDAACTTCHAPQGGVPGTGITEMHSTVPAHTVALVITSVTATGQGQQPDVRFTATLDGAPLNILTTPFSSLRATVAGPTSDYQSAWQATLQGSGASGTLTAVNAASGQFEYVLPASAAVPLTASGSYAIALEGSLSVSGTTYNPANPIVYVPVTDMSAVARRNVVDTGKCNACHKQLVGHGGSRRAAEYCVMCHNPERVNSDRSPHFEATTITPESVDLKVMIHKIHRGDQHTQPYVLGGFPAPTVANPAGTPVDFTELRYPGDLRDCQACHLAATDRVPLDARVRPTRFDTITCSENPSDDPDSYCPDTARVVSATTHLPPTGAVCTACHDDPSTAAHAQVNTTVLGAESCATCHGPGAAFDTASFHLLAP